MIAEYKINEQDFLEFHLYTASRSERINKKKRNGWIFLTIGSGVIAVYFYLNQNNPMAVYCGVVAVLCGGFYPKYFKWRYKRHYQKHIEENYSKQFGEKVTIEINDNSIITKDKTGEGKIHVSEIEKIDETGNHFFLKLTTGLSIIIPKTELSNSDEVRKKLLDIGLVVNDEKSWSW